mmetsp:Transcript_5944/g.16909  ORF Transcript_5944/g.16909 Transcript_5944/m.16909 type:complete len:159 (-) Transcript_5944:1208-1684(-)
MATPSQHHYRTNNVKSHPLISGRKLLRSSYPMDGKSIRSLLTSNASDVATVNDFRWAALLEMYSGSSNIGERYKGMKGYFHNHMVRLQETSQPECSVTYSDVVSTPHQFLFMFSDTSIQCRREIPNHGALLEVSKHVSGGASHQGSRRLGQGRKLVVR